MTLYKIILGSLAGIIAIVSYIPYLKDVLKGKTKSHAFSWFVWAMLTGIGFAVQIFEHGGVGDCQYIICFVA